MSWNYRIVRWPLTPEEAELVGADHYYDLRSVYYTDGVPDGVGAEPEIFVVHSAEGPEGLIASLRRAIATFEKHGVLDAKEIKGLVLSEAAPATDPDPAT